MANPLEEMLRTVLAPLGDRREIVMRWFEQEIATRPIITHVDDGSVDEKGNPLPWKLGGKSVLDSDATIFAIFIDEGTGDAIVYSFKSIQVAGDNGEKLGAVQFFRELVCEPKHIHGPISHDALFADLEGIFVGDDEPPKGKSNGVQHARS
jgi:hypothetical protein